MSDMVFIDQGLINIGMSLLSLDKLMTILLSMYAIGKGTAQSLLS